MASAEVQLESKMPQNPSTVILASQLDHESPIFEPSAAHPCSDLKRKKLLITRLEGAVGAFKGPSSACKIACDGQDYKRSISMM